jgi:hypothetical protein
MERSFKVIPEISKLLQCIAIAMCMIALSPNSLHAQIDVGCVTSTVKDSSGVLIARGHLTITNNAIKGNFQDELVRKLLTFITRSMRSRVYQKSERLPAIKRSSQLSEAANDPEIGHVVRQAYSESNDALCRRYGFDRQEQRQLTEAAIPKYQKREIVELLERNLRDPIRELSRNDHLIGLACLTIEYNPVTLSRGFAATLLYDHADDGSTLPLQRIVRKRGVRAALVEICKIEESSRLVDLILGSCRDLTNPGFGRSAT